MCAALILAAITIVSAQPNSHSDAVAGPPQAWSAVAASARPGSEVAFDHPGQASASHSIDLTEKAIIGGAQASSLLVVSVFRIDDVRLAEQLVDAARRGVHVEVLLNGGNNCTASQGCPSPGVRALQPLNTIHRKHPATWVRTCDGGTPANGDVATSNGNGCIGQGLDHNKFMAASRAQNFAGGPPTSLVLQTSTNNTGSQYRRAWNDALLLSGQPRVYQDYLRYFRQMVAASASSAPTSKNFFTPRDGTSIDTTSIAQHDIETWSFPRAPTDDAVANVLKQIPVAHRCHNTVSAGTTGPTRTHVYAAEAYISGRPLLISELARLQEFGCSVQVLYTTISQSDRDKLTTAGVQLHQACTPADTADEETAQYLHSKFFLIDGSDTAVGANRRVIFTGSENWTGNSLSGADNRMLRYVESAPKAHGSGHAPKLYNAYLQRWNTINTAVETNGQPTSDSCVAATDY